MSGSSFILIPRVQWTGNYINVANYDVNSSSWVNLVSSVWLGRLYWEAVWWNISIHHVHHKRTLKTSAKISALNYQGCSGELGRTCPLLCRSSEYGLSVVKEQVEGWGCHMKALVPGLKSPEYTETMVGWPYSAQPFSTKYGHIVEVGCLCLSSHLYMVLNYHQLAHPVVGQQNA